MKMKKAGALWLALVFAGLLGVQAFHSHSAHEGGVFTPHEDCSLCARSGGSTGNEAVLPSVLASPYVVLKDVILEDVRSDFSLPFLQPFGRAPPSSSHL
jgi:hypothetical protein